VRSGGGKGAPSEKCDDENKINMESVDRKPKAEPRMATVAATMMEAEARAEEGIAKVIAGRESTKQELT